MLAVPPELLAALPIDAEPVVKTWWATLSELQRLEVAQLWDERLEVKFFTPQATDDGQRDTWEQVPKVLGGRFVPSDDAYGLQDWGPSYFEHLLQHPELVVVWELKLRTFCIFA